MSALRTVFGVTAWLLLAAGTVFAQDAVNLPLDTAGLKLAETPGVTARMERLPAADNGKPAVQVLFSKPGAERRLLALEAPLVGNAAGVRAAALRYRVKLTRGAAPRLALLLFAQDGGAWYKMSPHPAVVGEFTEGRVPATSLQPAAFSSDTDAAAEWGKAKKVWLGLVLDGPAAGSLEISQARLTGEPYRADRPVRVTGDGPGAWSVGKDPAVQATLTTPAEGPDGKPCVRFEFQFPGQKHMFAIPAIPVAGIALDEYRALRFTYKAALPDGIPGLLVMLAERSGGQYAVEPPPPASADWRTVTLPFEQLKLGAWSKDANGQFDPGEVGSLQIGTHGTAAGAGGAGTIWIATVEFVP